MTSRRVMLTSDAMADIDDLYDYICEHDLPARAVHVREALISLIESLATAAERGTYPKELADLGIREYREVFFKPYRVIFRVAPKHVYVYLVSDGRRDMLKLLERRLLSS